MIELVNVTSVELQDGARLRVRFSNGAIGIRDLSDLLAEGGPMVEPLRDPAFFRRVFVQCGVLTWPNGFDLDPIQLYMELRDAGLLTKPNATAAE